MVEHKSSDVDFQSAFMEQEEAMAAIEVGDIVTGEVLDVSDEDVIVNVGLKCEGRIKKTEFDELGETVKKGDKIQVKILAKETDEGTSRVSRVRAAQEESWNKINAAFKDKTSVQGKVVGEIKGGFQVDIGLTFLAFLPRSQATTKKRTTLPEIQNKSFDFEIRELDKRRKNIVLSRKSIIESEQLKLREETLKGIIVGAVIDGVVKNITNFGVFVDIGGIDGLVTLGDLSWGGFVKDASTIVKKGDKVKVKVLEFTPIAEPGKTPKIRLGLKQAQGDPWEEVLKKHRPGEIIEGIVKSCTNFGAFVEVIPGVDGLVHVSEISWTEHVKMASNVLKEGDKVMVKIVSIEPDKRKLSLSIKQATPDPWSQAYDEYPPNMRLKGTVTGVTNFGAFVKLPSGIEGMIHRSDISWDNEEIDPKTKLKIGDEIEVMVLKVDSENQKLSLGLKQTTSDPWNEITRTYQKNKIVEAEVVRFDSEGAWIKLDEKNEGFIPNQELSTDRNQKPENAVQIGQKVRARVTKLERKGSRIFLSIRELIKDEEASTVKKFMSSQEKSGAVTLGDMLGDSELASKLQQLVSKQSS